MRAKTWLLLTFVCIATWLATLFLALSDCTPQALLHGKCDCSPTKLLYGQCDYKSIGSQTAELQTDALTRAALKGQFGDFFGVLNALFGAFTVLLVYRTWSAEQQRSKAERQEAAAALAQQAKDAKAAREQAEEQFAGSLEAQRQQVMEAKRASDAQIDLVRRERYYAEVEAAIQAYNGLLRDVAARQWRDKQHVELVTTWTGRHGLFHLWKTNITQRGVDGHWGYSQIDPLMKSALAGMVWHPVARQHSLSNFGPVGTTPQSDERDTHDWVRNQLLAGEREKLEYLAKMVRVCWIDLYGSQRYQLDALFRAWFHVCKALESAELHQIDIDTEWRLASRFRAQLSWVELTYIMANQVFADGPEGEGFPDAIKYCARYAFFDNFVSGLDPTVHAVLLLAQGAIVDSDVRLLPRQCFDSQLAKPLLTRARNDNV